MWLISAAGPGVVLLMPGMVTWGTPSAPVLGATLAATNPDAEMPDTALLNRREHPPHDHRPNRTP